MERIGFGKHVLPKPPPPLLIFLYPGHFMCVQHLPRPCKHWCFKTHINDNNEKILGGVEAKMYHFYTEYYSIAKRNMINLWYMIKYPRSNMIANKYFTRVFQISSKKLAILY